MKRMTNRRSRRRNAEFKNYQPTSAPLCVLRGRNLFAQLKTAVSAGEKVKVIYSINNAIALLMELAVPSFVFKQGAGPSIRTRSRFPLHPSLPASDGVSIEENR